jgi:hypothetical protein
VIRLLLKSTLRVLTTPAEILLDGLECFIFLDTDVPRIRRTETYSIIMTSSKLRC